MIEEYNKIQKDLFERMSKDFEVALPRLMASVATIFNVNETKLYEYITKK